MSKLETKKRAYVKMVETLVTYGYDITEFLNPTWSIISTTNCINVCNEMKEKHEGSDVWSYDEKLTINNI